MKLIAPNLYQFRFPWPNAFNAYYIQTETESIVMDASIRWDWPFMRHQLKGKPLDAVVLSHAHPDHQGCAAKICRTFDVPLICHDADADSASGKAPLVRHNPVWEIIGNLAWAGPRSPVARRLQEGDTIAGFTVYHLPGHTAGQIALLRHSDRVAIVGDVINTNDYISGFFSIVREPPRTFSVSPAQNRDSIRRLLALNPSLICTGHGPPLRDIRRLERLVSKLKKDTPIALAPAP